MKSFFPTAILAWLCISLCTPVDAKPHKKYRAKAGAKAAAKANQSAPASHGEAALNFSQWPGVSQFIDEMVAKHQFDQAELQKLMQRTHYIERAVQLIKPAPPGRPKNWQAFRKLVVEPVRMRAGLQFWNQYAEALARAENDYGVPAEIIVGILGVETVYGKNTGSFRVLDVVSTLAFAYPESPKRLERMAFFRGELENTLLLARESHIDPLSLQGSYAGAIGLPQFMPGSIRQYAVDHDGDGKIDLLRSPQDAIGSIAYFLQKHGWRRGETSVFAAQVNPGAADNNNWQRFLNQGLVAKYTLTEMQAAGVSTSQSVPAETLLGLVDLQNGQESTEYYLGTNNFFTLTQYNRSYFYAMSVLELGSAIRQLRGR
jgi:membrane-bound lytic murein transglycosylase B